jgi:hypothetical protein
MKENALISGKVIVRSHPAGTIARYNELKAEGRVAEAQQLLKSGKVEVVQKNLIVFSLNHGYDLLVQYLLSAYVGSLAFPLGIAWGEIGTGNTAPATADTALTTPTNRTTVSYAADLGYNEAQLQFFFPDATLTNGTYYEFGTFIGGSSTIGTGNMFNHALFAVPYSKSAGTDTTVEVDFSFAAQSSGFDQGGFS